MNYIKKHWKTIIIVLLVIFSLNKCTQSCNRATTIDKQQIEIMQHDSIIKTYNDSIKLLNVRLNEMERSQTNYQNLAVGTKEELVNTIGDMRNTHQNEIQSLKSTIKAKDRIIEMKDREILSLQKQLNDKE